MNGHYLTKFCIHINVHRIKVEIARHLFKQIFKLLHIYTYMMLVGIVTHHQFFKHRDALIISLSSFCDMVGQKSDPLTILV